MRYTNPRLLYFTLLYNVSESKCNKLNDIKSDIISDIGIAVNRPTNRAVDNTSILDFGGRT